MHLRTRPRSTCWASSGTKPDERTRRENEVSRHLSSPDTKLLPNREHVNGQGPAVPAAVAVAVAVKVCDPIEQVATWPATSCTPVPWTMRSMAVRVRTTWSWEGEGTSACGAGDDWFNGGGGDDWIHGLQGEAIAFDVVAWS